jgi:8-oxo-dGTP pyrophosphatase MutT (NUDIX family)
MRDAAGRGIEVFCVLRHQKSGFLGGAVVFPGGKVDPSDHAEAWAELSTEPDARVAEMSDGVTPRALAVAACREILEEGFIVPLDPPLDDDGASALRHQATSLFDGVPRGLAAALGAFPMSDMRPPSPRRRLALDRLVPWARWITPEAEPRRFDARFFLLELPPGQVGRHDDHETTMSFWDTPAAILQKSERGEIFLAPPTTRTLEVLSTVSSVQGAFALAARQSLRPICPLLVPDDRAPFLALPGDPAHPVREPRVAGPTRFVFREGRLVSEEAPGHETLSGVPRPGRGTPESVPRPDPPEGATGGSHG